MIDPVAWEPWIRASVFSAVVVLLGLGEAFAPRRPRRGFRQIFPNVGLFVTDTFVLRLVSATSLIGVAAIATDKGWGLLQATHAPAWLEATVAVVMLDFSMYVQHRMFHWTPWFWRLHAVHHSDTEFDVTTGIRFHVGETLLSFAIKLAVVFSLGAPVWAVIVFEALLSSASLFTHANLRLPSRLDRALRVCIVTPDVHRVHHSTAPDEHNQNFGFLLIWWDRWFRTYRTQPRVDHDVMPIGLERYRRPEQQTFGSLLKQPFAPYREAQ